MHIFAITLQSNTAIMLMFGSTFLQGQVQANSRKLLGFNEVLDYDYAGPNPRHKKGGGGSKSP